MRGYTDKALRAHCTPEETGAIFIDYIQKVRLATGESSRDRYLQLQHVSDELRRLASDLNIPVVVGAQLNRSVGRWPPSLDHIRESADIGQDASLVLALKKYKGAQEGTEQLRLRVCKDRRGPAHYDLTFAFHGATYRVESLKQAELETLGRKDMQSLPEGGVWLPLTAESDDPLVRWS